MRPQSVRYPAVDLLVQRAAAARSVSTALLELAKSGRLADLERDIGAMRRNLASGGDLVKGPDVTLAKSAGAGRAPRAAAGYAASEIAWQRSAPARALAKAAEYSDLAMKAIDPETREMWLSAAREKRQAAGQ